MVIYTIIYDGLSSGVVFSVSLGGDWTSTFTTSTGSEEPIPSIAAICFFWSSVKLAKGSGSGTYPGGLYSYWDGYSSTTLTTSVAAIGGQGGNGGRGHVRIYWY